MKEFGYAEEILKVDLSSRHIAKLDTARYAGRFLGGRGVAAKIYWDETSPNTQVFDPQNPFICITGPLAGFTRFSGCRWEICGKSPEMDPESFSYANLGGSWGAYLKYAGYDGVVVTGKAEKPVYLLIDGSGKVEIRDALHLWGKTAVEARGILESEMGKETKVLDIGPAGENLVSFSTVLAAENASGSSGFGSVMGSKNLKAIAVKAEPKRRPIAADPERLKSLANQVYKLRTRNFEDYGHLLPLQVRFTACHGCISGCTRGTYEAENGLHFKSFCQAADFYAGAAMKFYGRQNQEVSLLATRLCDKFGLDTAVMSPLISWLSQCYEAGILSDEKTGLPLSKIGSSEFIETLVKKLSYREGFGDILAQGPLKAADYVGEGSKKLLNSLISTRAGETRDHDPRLVLANAILYATEPRRSPSTLHATVLPVKRWTNWLAGWKDAYLSTEILQDIAKELWGSAEAGDLNTYAGKALASKKIQDYGYIKESLILCDLVWPIYQVHSPETRLGPFTLESQILSAVTGRNITEKELEKVGERIFNLQRAILIRQGWGGRRGDNLLNYLFEEPLERTFFDPECIVPNKEGKIVSRKGAIIEQKEFERLKDEYYLLRGWDVKSGLQTKSKLEELDLTDIAQELEKIGLLK